MRLLDMHYKCIAPLFTFQKNLAASSPSFSAKTDINDMVNRYDVPEKEDGFYSLSQEILPRPKHP